MIMDELSFTMSENNPSLYFLILAGLYREEFPWISEILTEIYREIRDGNPENAERIVINFQRTIKTMMNSKMFFELSNGSKDIMFFLEELPMLIDMAIHRKIQEKNTSEKLL
jgi:hypothetical protein